MDVFIPDPPGVVTFETTQVCGNLVTTWTVLLDDPLPITGYFVNISGDTMLVAGDKTTYSYPISESDCGTTLESSVFAISAAGNGNVTSPSIADIVCTREGNGHGVCVYCCYFD